MLSVLLSALCPPAPLKSLTFWHYTSEIVIVIIIIIIIINSILIFVACPYWKSQGKVREFNVVWKVVTLS